MAYDSAYDDEYDKEYEEYDDKVNDDKVNDDLEDDNPQSSLDDSKGNIQSAIDKYLNDTPDMDSILSEQINFLKEISDDHLESLYWYTVGDCRALNARMREGKKLSKRQQIHKDHIMDIFNSIPPLKEQITVWRGFSSKVGYDKNMFISTTIDKSIAYGYVDVVANCCIYQIVITPGSKIIPMWTISGFTTEQEILLCPGNVVIVTGEYIERDMKIINMTYIPAKYKKI